MADDGRDCTVDLVALQRRPAVLAGTVTTALTVTVHGDVDPTALNRLHELLAGLAAAPTPVVIEVDDARCSTGRLLALLCRFRDGRRADGLECRLQGLHPGAIPDLDAVDLADAFVIYDDALRAIRRRDPRRG